MPKEIKITEEMLAKAWNECSLASDPERKSFNVFKAALGFREPLRVECQITWTQWPNRGPVYPMTDKCLEHLIGLKGKMTFVEDAE